MGIACIAAENAQPSDSTVRSEGASERAAVAALRPLIKSSFLSTGRMKERDVM
jgi:hypothetical protein